MKISVVIPVFNEEQNISPMCDELISVMSSLGRDYEVLLVDDGSTDQTYARMLENKIKFPQINIIKFKSNCGQTAAFWAGIHNASGDVIITMDGDMQNDPSDIPAMLPLLENFDLVCGWRKSRQDSAWRRFQSRSANRIRNRFLKDGIQDTGCSLKVFKKPTPDMLPPYTGMHRFIPALLKYAGYSLTEIPVGHRHRSRGTTKYGFQNRALRAFQDLLGVIWIMSRKFNYEIEKPDGC